jgi:hypothetical protein
MSANRILPEVQTPVKSKSSPTGEVVNEAVKESNSKVLPQTQGKNMDNAARSESLAPSEGRLEVCMNNAATNAVLDPERETRHAASTSTSATSEGSPSGRSDDHKSILEGRSPSSTHESTLHLVLATPPTEHRSSRKTIPRPHPRQDVPKNASHLSDISNSSSEDERTKSLGAVKPDKKMLYLTDGDRLAVPLLTFPVKHQSAPSKLSSIPVQRAARESSPPDSDSSESSEEVSEGDESDLSALMATVPPGDLQPIWEWMISARREKPLQTFFVIAKELSRDLTKKEIQAGFIYAFRVADPQGRGYLKIGAATDCQLRMKQHKRCYGDCEQLFPLEDEKAVPVNHVFRVESLIHAELVEYAMRLKRCPRLAVHHVSHGEWFDVGEVHALDVIAKWHDVFSFKLFEERPITRQPSTRKKGKKGSSKEPSKTIWRLRELHWRDIMSFCTPLTDAMGDEEGSAVVEAQAKVQTETPSKPPRPPTQLRLSPLIDLTADEEDGGLGDAQKEMQPTRGIQSDGGPAVESCVAVLQNTSSDKEDDGDMKAQKNVQPGGVNKPIPRLKTPSGSPIGKNRKSIPADDTERRTPSLSGDELSIREPGQRQPSRDKNSIVD